MPKRSYKKLPSRLGVCRLCHKDTYRDAIAAGLALEFLSKNPPRGGVEPSRYYPCPRKNGTYHLTSDRVREMYESA